MSDPWGILLILGPLLLLGVMIYAWSRNRAAAKDRGQHDEAAVLGTTNAVVGSDEARPDIEAEVARAEEGEKRD